MKINLICKVCKRLLPLKKEDELAKIAERYCIYSLLENHKTGLTFKQIKYSIKMKESRLRDRLSELVEHQDLFYKDYHYIANLNIKGKHD